MDASFGQFDVPPALPTLKQSPLYFEYLISWGSETFRTQQLKEKSCPCCESSSGLLVCRLAIEKHSMFTVDCFTLMTWNVRQAVARSDNKEHEPAYMTQIPIVMLADAAMTASPST
jgi:hypothetical protein